MSNTITFDIETAPLPDTELQPFMPTEWALGNIKDPDKIRAAIESKKAAWKSDAALSAMTGRVLVIGLLIESQFIFIGGPATEATMLHEFWSAVEDGQDIHRLIGFNCCSFDLPFLIQRSWKFGVPVPRAIRRGRYWSDNIVDLRDIWQCGDRQAHGSLDTISKHLGTGAKTGSGADFHLLWSTDQAKAIEYLKNDLLLTSKMASKLGVL